ncbi:ThiF family adenylyltransferase [Shewanella sp. 10N.286.51.B2]|uniref:HesA/MoeB/ThiF family protein n=1 Tax=unclassified Shewanella TaxID=196818 RepID=UPI0026E235F1|nr:HesA/MoeB/ThiF family protein [Shewanella sp. 5_MG-2023]MDO6641556.1 HesA/MoeB/ThiF family protein [Shewanella sp. 5_MG-2023]
MTITQQRQANKSGLTSKQFIKYASHILLTDMGELGQLKLLNSRLLIIGIGGLGHSVAQQLAAAGVGELILMDHDKVELSNLSRQLLFNEQDIGLSKALLAKDKLAAAYEDVNIMAIEQAFGAHTEGADTDGAKLVESVDLVFDCTDNFTSRLMINEVCVRHATGLISAAISANDGQLFCSSTDYPQRGCYQCLYPQDTHVSQTCVSMGVNTAAVQTVASMQSLLGLNWLTADDLGKGQLAGKLHVFNAKSLQWQIIQMNQDPKCSCCSAAITASTNDVNSCR